MNTNRRTFLKSSGALGAAGSVAAVSALSGCASIGGSGPKVVIVGGGYGGATAARYIKMWAPNIEVTLVERNAEFISCPISNLVLGGSKTMQDITISYDALARKHGVKVVRGEAVAVDAEKKTVRLANGDSLAFDRVILSPGIDFMFEDIPGLNNAAAQERILHAWKAGPQTTQLRPSTAKGAGCAETTGSDEGWRCGRDFDSRGTLSLSARPLRARLPDRRVPEAVETEIESGDSRRQSGRNFQTGVVQKGVGGNVSRHRRIPRQLQSG